MFDCTGTRYVLQLDCLSYYNCLIVLHWQLSKSNVRFLLLGNGLILSEHVERGFRQVDRKYFVPKVCTILDKYDCNLFKELPNHFFSSKKCFCIQYREMRSPRILINLWEKETSTYQHLISTVQPWRCSSFNLNLLSHSWTSEVEQVTCLVLWLKYWAPSH